MVRLEKVRLEQRRSTYEVSGDYTIPAGAPLPRTAASLALPPGGGGGAGERRAAGATARPQEAVFDPASGRWRIQVRREAYVQHACPGQLRLQA